MTFRIEKFDPKNAPDHLYAAHNSCSNQMRAERLPDDPPVPLEATMQSLKNIPDFIKLVPWVVWQEDAPGLMGYCGINYSNQDNLHLAQFTINVLPQFRQQGLGKAMLAKIAEVAQEENRSILITDTVARVPSGEAFMQRVGAKRGLEAHTNQLRLADIDRELLTRWLTRANEATFGFELGIWSGPYPEEYLDQIVDLHDLFNQQPFGDLEVEEFTFSPGQIRQMEQSMFARGYKRLTFFVREKESGNFAGYTEVSWHPSRVRVINQGITGVFPHYRNKGLGRLLKAAMLDKILTELPDAKFVRTDNADMNAPMMKINNELGFKPYNSESVWQMQTATVMDYLSQ